MSPPSSESLSFEQALVELERILRNLEDGTTSLEESLAQYERGVGLLKGCYQLLRDAEQRIVQVSGVDADGKPVFEPFEHTSAVEREGKKPAAPKVKAGPRPNGEY
jgi:exodeoxyribonuclease VII small subunit